MDPLDFPINGKYVFRQTKVLLVLCTPPQILPFNFVSVVIIKGSIKKKDPKEFLINDDIKNSSYENLFDFIVDCIAKFVKDRNIGRQLPIGFTFPFPMKHESLTRGKLIRWTRDFKFTGAEGKDVVQLLEEAASRRGVSIRN